MATIQRKFAWIPIVVSTWRNTRALIWLQSYYHKTGKDFDFYIGEINVNKKYCLKIGMFSKELSS